MQDYDRIYDEHDDYFGTEPSRLLTTYAGHLGAGSRALDIGIGQGRNALPLARRGVHVTGLDPSGGALRNLFAIVEREQLPIDLFERGFMDYLPPKGRGFDLVMAFGLLQILRRDEGASLLYRLHRWTRPGGLLLLGAWHVDDPDYERISTSWRRIGLHSFRDEGGQVRTFLGRGEARDLLLGWNVSHYFEGIGPEHGHGDGRLKRHGEVEVAAIRAT